MGSAVIEAGRKVGTDESFGEGAVKAITETTNGANACQSFWEAEDGAAGVTGVRLSAGSAQQACPQHWQSFEPQHLRAAGAVDVATPVATAERLCHTVAKLTKTARSTIAALRSRVEIELVTFCSLNCMFTVSATGLL